MCPGHAPEGEPDPLLWPALDRGEDGRGGGDEVGGGNCQARHGEHVVRQLQHRSLPAGHVITKVRRFQSSVQLSPCRPGCCGGSQPAPARSASRSAHGSVTLHVGYKTRRLSSGASHRVSVLVGDVSELLGVTEHGPEERPGQQSGRREGLHLPHPARSSGKSFKQDKYS